MRCRVGVKWLYMGGCLRAMRVMLRGVLHGILRGVLRGAAWCCVVLHDTTW